MRVRDSLLIHNTREEDDYFIIIHHNDEREQETNFTFLLSLIMIIIIIEADVAMFVSDDEPYQTEEGRKIEEAKEQIHLVGSINAPSIMRT